MAEWIETERTRLRPFEEADAAAAFAWFSDAEVMRFIPRGRDITVDDTRARIAGYREHQARFGFSKWLVVHRETGEALGDSGLLHLPDGVRIELGFRFARAHWGAGYALEVGRAWLQWYDTHHPDRPLFADVHADHHRSQRVLAKLGFRPSHPEVIFDMPMMIYQRATPGEPIIRAIRADELADLLALYRHLHPADPELAITTDVTTLWQRINADPHLHYLGAEVEGRLVSTCTLTLIPNLTRGARPYGLIENVVTHPDFRRRGLGTALLRAALRLAWDQQCYKVMLLTGRQEASTLRFYQQAGFEGGVKTGFVAKP